MTVRSAVASRVLAALNEVIKKSNQDVPLHEPSFAGNEWTYLKGCLDSTFVSSIGEYVDRFEKMLSDYTGVKRAVAVVNGTSALHAALKLSGAGAGDEVLVPTFTFVATANAVSYLGAIPHFVDSEEKTLGLDPCKLHEYLEKIGEMRSNGCYNKQTGNRIRAVIPVHIFGHPVDMDPLSELAKRFQLELIEDATESLGSFYKGKHTGHWGRFSVLSFNGNKIITTGGGGAILTNDEELAAQARHITTTSRLPHKWEYCHDEVGFNYRMPNINAALGCAQLERLPFFLDKKRKLSETYADAFSEVEGVTFFREPEFSRSNYWLNALIIEKGKGARDDVLDLTNKKGIMTRPAWILMHKLPMFSRCPKMDLSVAESLENRLINIPSSATL